MNASTLHDKENTLSPLPVSLREAFLFWLKLGFISFGGPAGQIAILHQELVERRRWISERRFLHALNYCMLLPGPEAQQLATYMGWLMHGTRGGIIAGGLFILPSLFILIGLSWVYMVWGNIPVIAGLFYGIKPAVTAIVFHAAHRIGGRVLKNRILWVIAVISFTAVFAFKIPFPFIVAAAALAGYVGGKKTPSAFQTGSSHQGGVPASQGAVPASEGEALASLSPAFIGDTTPIPPHARFSRAGLIRTLLTGGLLWALPLSLLVLFLGWPHTLTQMGWFFTKAALLTFGGAYAVLPYVYQGAVEAYRWLTPVQMMDGLALGETTPGPLIMVVAFIGFTGGYQSAELSRLFGPEHLFIAGAVAATLVSWFTFLPSFVFILAGGPLVESTHNNLAFTAPLTAITAAVVGVIVNLACFFAYHIFWPGGFSSSFDWIAGGISLAAGLMLFRFKRNVMEVIIACALLGLFFQMRF